MPTRLRGIVSNRKAENHPDSRPISDVEAHSVVEDTGLDCHVPDDTAVGEQSASMLHRQSESMVHRHAHDGTETRPHEPPEAPARRPGPQIGGDRSIRCRPHRSRVRRDAS